VDESTSGSSPTTDFGVCCIESERLLELTEV